MKAKTIFLSNNKTDIYVSDRHNDNHLDYIETNKLELEINNYIPLLLVERDICVIDISINYSLGVIYLPNVISDYQKDYFYKAGKELEKYNLYLGEYSLVDSVSLDSLYKIIESKCCKKKDLNKPLIS